MDTKHTPGPWIYLDGVLFSESAGYHIMSFSAKEAGELDGNGAILSAAPDMYKALSIMVETFQNKGIGAITADETSARIFALAYANGILATVRG